ncbi:MAG: hypothetical protein KO318_11710 [Methanobacterium sp.]|jgi:hypothetical protein|nr:hypothetical protein [Methanobacterium sp.]
MISLEVVDFYLSLSTFGTEVLLTEPSVALELPVLVRLVLLVGEGCISHEAAITLIKIIITRARIVLFNLITSHTPFK